MNRYYSFFVAFVSGAIVMIFELAGTRVVAPYLGNSLPVWTSIIGVILASLSAGYYLGGRLADANLKKNMLSVLFLFSMLAVGWCVVANYWLLGLINLNYLNLNIAALLSSIVLFAPAGVGLGMITPYLVRLNLQNIEKSGSTVGNLYAVSTLGSISGTFLAGYYLIPFFGTVQILYGLSAILFIMYVVARINKPIIKSVLLFLFISVLYFVSWGAWHLSVYFLIDDVDTAYARYMIFEDEYKDTGKLSRFIATDPFGVHGAVLVEDINEPLLPYQGFYVLHQYFNPDSQNALVLGGGVMSMARDYINTSSGIVDVVEIDPGLTKIAKEYFYYTDNERIKIIHDDARRYLVKNKKKYDCIFIDVYSSNLSIPFHLTTVEALNEIKNDLEPNGVVIANIISAVIGEKGAFFQSELATFKEVFPRLHLYQVDSLKNMNEAQNLILVALNNDVFVPPQQFNENLHWYLNHEIEAVQEEGIKKLTDNHAPIEYKLLKIF